MERKGDEVHIDTEEASGGDRDKSVSVVVIVGTVLAIALLSLVWITGALTSETAEPQAQTEASASPSGN